MPIHKNRYVVVNIWTSEKNQAVKGVNVGHVSLTIHDRGEETYLSFWPFGYKEYSNAFFKVAAAPARALFSAFIERPPSYIHDYEQDCFLEGYLDDNTPLREIRLVNDCKEGEVPCIYNEVTEAVKRIIHQPRGIHPDEKICAVKLLSPHIRLVLFSLDVDLIHQEFKRLKNSDVVTGWSLAGSNLFTRNLNVTGKTSENCASIVYRCLQAGGLYEQVASQHSAPLSSAVTPDDLLRLIVAVKASEQNLYIEPSTDWQIPGIAETPLNSLLDAYASVGQNVNAAEDIFPRSKPTNVTCSLL